MFVITFLLDLLVVAFFSFAFYRMSIQESDEVIEKKQKVTEEHIDHMRDALEKSFDEDSTSTSDTAVQDAVIAPSK